MRCWMPFQRQTNLCLLNVFTNAIAANMWSILLKFPSIFHWVHIFSLVWSFCCFSFARLRAVYLLLQWNPLMNEAVHFYFVHHETRQIKSMLSCVYTVVFSLKLYGKHVWDLSCTEDTLVQPYAPFKPWHVEICAFLFYLWDFSSKYKEKCEKNKIRTTITPPHRRRKNTHNQRT